MFNNTIFYMTLFITFLIINIFGIKDPEQIKIIFSELKYPLILFIITIMYSSITFFLNYSKELKTVKDLKYFSEEISLIKQMGSIVPLGIITFIVISFVL